MAPICGATVYLNPFSGSTFDATAVLEIKWIQALGSNH